MSGLDPQMVRQALVLTAFLIAMAMVASYFRAPVANLAKARNPVERQAAKGVLWIGVGISCILTSSFAVLFLMC